MRIEEEKYLKSRIFDAFCFHFPNGVIAKDLFEAIKSKKIQLEIQGIDGTNVIKDDLTNEIIESMEFLNRISEKPYSFIKAKEEKVHIEVAKKINYKAIQNLSKDSNDWYARTFLTVKPKKIVAETNEETLNIYENRFFVSLIDRLFDYVTKYRNGLETKRERLEKEMTEIWLEKDFTYRALRKGTTGLTRALSNYDDSKSVIQLKNINDKIESLRLIEDRLLRLKSNRLYQDLKSTRRVSNPIQKTSIIVQNQNYNKAFRLWELLENKKINEFIDLDEIQKRDVVHYYSSYVVFNLIAAIYDLGFIENSHNKISMKNGILLIEFMELNFQKNQERIRLIIQGQSIQISYCLNEVNGIWENIFIKANYTNFEGKSRLEVSEISNEIIREQIRLKTVVGNNEKKKLTNKLIGYYDFVSIDIHYCSKSNEFREDIYRRFYSIGDNYDSHEKDIIDMAGYKTGIQIISPMDLQSNLLRIQRIINTRRFSRNAFSSLKTCPICGVEKEFKSLSNGECICHYCGHGFSDFAKCANCKKTFPWVKYLDDKKVKDPEVINTIKGRPYYFRLSKYESIMGSYAITSFDLNEESTGLWKLKSICPHCCSILGETKS